MNKPAYQFIKNINPKNDYCVTRVIMEIDSHDIDRSELIESFEDFIKGCGFYLKGSLEMVEDE